MNKNVISVKNLTKKYGKLVAVDNISFEVQKNEVFGLLGENGAGKTTTLEIIEGLRKPTAGKIQILGMDSPKNLQKIKEKIGVQLQASAYYNFLTLREILDLLGSFYRQHLKPDQLLNLVNLQDKADSLIANLSGGQKQRFSIVASLVNDPEIVFLDEPTTGLDPLARRHLWEIIAEVKKQGKTIVLTTHYMEEADILCDRIAIMDKGKIIIKGKPHQLVQKTKTPFKMSFVSSDDRLVFRIEKLGELRELAGKSGHFEVKFLHQADLNRAINIVKNSKSESITVGRASLEDLFIELTGKTIEEENA